MGQNKYTLESFQQRMESYFPNDNFTILDFTGITKPVKFQCNKCGRIWEYTTADHLVNRWRMNKNKSICQYCEGSHRWEAERAEGINKFNYLLENKKTLKLLTPIRTLAAPVEFFCTKCGHKFKRTPTQFINKNQKCPWCEGQFQNFNLEIIKEKAREEYGEEYTVLSDEKWDYSKSDRVKVRHNKCGFIYDTNCYSFLRGHGCPRCKCSVGERKVRTYLQAHNFVFQEQYSFENTEISTLKFDFYLEENNQRYCIEYNGNQHYGPVDFFGGEEAFIAQQERDRKKQIFCQENNINLIIIPYYDESLIKTEALAQRLHGELSS